MVDLDCAHHRRDPHDARGAIDTSVLGDNHLYDVRDLGPGRDALTIDAGGQSQVFAIGGLPTRKGAIHAQRRLAMRRRRSSYDSSLAACLLGFGSKSGSKPSW